MAKLSGWAFPVEVDDATGRIRMVEDNECVRQDIQLILQTDRGERKMRPNFGAGLNRFMFQNVDLVLVNRMSEAMAQSIRMWEEHIRGANVGVMQSPDNSAAVLVNVEYITDISPTQRQEIREELELNRGGR